MSYYAQGNGVLRALRFAGPTCLDNAIAETRTQFGGVGTVATVYFDAARHADEAKYVITVNRVAATCQFEIYAFQVLVDDEHIFFASVFVGLCRVSVVPNNGP